MNCGNYCICASKKPGCYEGRNNRLNCFKEIEQNHRPHEAVVRLNDLLNAKFGNDAIQRCIDIYMDYHVSEVKKLPPATQLAWELGQKARECVTTGI